MPLPDDGPVVRGDGDREGQDRLDVGRLREVPDVLGSPERHRELLGALAALTGGGPSAHPGFTV